MTETTAKKGDHFVAMTKKVASFLEGKTGVTPSVAAPADTNPSDATGCKYDVKIHREVHGKEMSK